MSLPHDPDDPFAVGEEVEASQDNKENLPEVIKPYISHVETVQEFLIVREVDGDKEVTQADLNQLNNHLHACHIALKDVDDIPKLCALSAAVCKLIETRRKVKKLPWGDQNLKGGSRVFEVLE